MEPKAILTMASLWQIPKAPLAGAPCRAGFANRPVGNLEITSGNAGHGLFSYFPIIGGDQRGRSAQAYTEARIVISRAPVHNA